MDASASWAESEPIGHGGEAPLSAGRLTDAAARLPEELRPLAVGAAGRLGPGLDGGTVYTDDRAPVEWLIDESLIEYAAE